jgi:hypothetical protein
MAKMSMDYADLGEQLQVSTAAAVAFIFQSCAILFHTCLRAV